MARVNDHYLELKSELSLLRHRQAHRRLRRGAPRRRAHPARHRRRHAPAARRVVTALHEAADEMARPETFKGYGPETGYAFLTERSPRTTTAPAASRSRPTRSSSATAPSATRPTSRRSSRADCTVALTDPGVPGLRRQQRDGGPRRPADATGRYDRLVYLPATAENGFSPALPDRPVDLIYLCYPNNPTGAVLPRDGSAEWVDYARRHQAVILYDAAYEAYIRDPDVPHSIFEIDGAREVRHRVPELLEDGGVHGHALRLHRGAEGAAGASRRGRAVSLHALWFRRQTTKFNGVPVRHPEGAARRSTPTGAEAGARGHRLLHGERADHPRRPRARGLTVYGGAQRAVHLGEDPPGLAPGSSSTSC